MFIFQYGAEGMEPIVSDDKIMFGIHAHAKSVLTLAKIRKLFRKSDSRAVAREVCVHGIFSLVHDLPLKY